MATDNPLKIRSGLDVSGGCTEEPPAYREAIGVVVVREGVVKMLR